MKFYFNKNSLFKGTICIIALIFMSNYAHIFAQNTSPVTRYNPYPDMSYIKGGKANFGNDKGEDNEKPSFGSQIRPFYLDNQPITVAQFRLFARINRYITSAEIQGFSEKFLEKNNTKDPKTEKIQSAYWEYPQGKNMPKAQNNEPARHLTWQDAHAYATWINKRLPTEFELEYALQMIEKNSENTQNIMQMLNGEAWHWSDSAFTKYDAQGYYEKNNKNPLRVIKGGAGKQRSAARMAQQPEKTFFDVIFRCAKDEAY